MTAKVSPLLTCTLSQRTAAQFSDRRKVPGLERRV